MKFIPLIATLFISSSLSAQDITIEAHKEQLREIIFDKLFPVAVFEGTATITSQTGFIKYPTRFVIGIYVNKLKNMLLELFWNK